MQIFFSLLSVVYNNFSTHTKSISTDEYIYGIQLRNTSKSAWMNENPSGAINNSEKPH